MLQAAVNFLLQVPLPEYVVIELLQRFDVAVVVVLSRWLAVGLRVLLIA